MLADLGGKPLIQHVWESAKRAKLLQRVLIACDDAEVFRCASRFGADVVMTNESHNSGSDRVAEAVVNLDCEVVLNIQGDEPFVHAQTIDDLAYAMASDASVFVGTIVKPLSTNEAADDPNVVKCVVDSRGDAIYFSRAAIPHIRDSKAADSIVRYKHVGMYAYRKQFLLEFASWPTSALELAEQLEQLRVLDRGYRIRTVVSHRESLAIDTPLDLQKARLRFGEKNADSFAQ